MSAEPFARAISIDYSDDELDAIAEAFTRPDLGRRRADADEHDPIRRAQNQTALRGLVARRAIRLGGTPARPRMTFLEPHATLLGALLGAPAVATVGHDARTETRAVSLFATTDVVVEQAARPGMAIQRLTAHPPGAAAELLHAALALPALPPPAATGSIELTERMLALTLEAVGRGTAAPDRVPAAAVDVLYARRTSSSLTISARDASGTRSSERWSWIDAGDVGLWLADAVDGGPIVRLTIANVAELADRLTAAWRQVVPMGSA